MKKVLLFILVCTIFTYVKAYGHTCSDSTLIQKKGWLVYWHGQVIWVKANFSKNVNNLDFFKTNFHYRKGLIVDYNSNAKFFKSIAGCFQVQLSQLHDSIESRKTRDTICLIPVIARIKNSLATYQEMSTLNIFRGGKVVTIDYCFEQNFDIVQIELYRKGDYAKIKRVKHYEIDPSY